MQVLVVEDEVRLAETLAQLLREQKYVVDVVHDGKDGLAYAESGQYDVIVLDVMLPGMDGYQVARTLRRKRYATPILMLTARSGVSDKVAGLDCGADDYMTKPFAPEELLARVRALTRRQGEVVLEELTFEDLRLELTTDTLKCGRSLSACPPRSLRCSACSWRAGAAWCPRRRSSARSGAWSPTRRTTTRRRISPSCGKSCSISAPGRPSPRCGRWATGWKRPKHKNYRKIHSDILKM